MKLPVYLLMISFGKVDAPIDVLNDYLAAEKPVTKTKFIVVDNSEVPLLGKQFKFSDHPDIIYHHFRNRNKAAAINFAVKKLIKEEEALVICIDDDISFNVDYLWKYFQAAVKKGKGFYFGSSFFVNPPKDFDRNLVPYLSGSALGQPDAQFQKMNRLMFLGFSYCFFKSQWKKVDGLDERFSPGSKYDLAAEESIFQKKLKYAGFKPYFVKDNLIQHKPLPRLYSEKMVKFRQEQNGFTHGFQNLISSSKTFKIDYFRQLTGYIWQCLLFLFTKDRLDRSMKFAYTKGFFKALLLFLRYDDNRNYLTEAKN